MIHPTAIVDPGAEIDANVEIGPYAVIHSDVSIGSGTTIGPFVTIDSHVKIGQDCHIYQYASIGGDPQDLKFHGETTYLTIGRRTTVREFATINRGTGAGGGVTEVGEENFLMAYAHVAHDCKTGKRVILANCATLAGHVEISDDVTVGGLAAVHQFVRIGNHAYIGGKSAVVKDIPPYVIAAGDRATLHGLNTVGLQRNQFSDTTLSQLKKAYRIVFRIGLTLNEAVERVRADVAPTPEVMRFIDFITSSERGITR
ncbi:MAG: acyl-[acyl-carrier-protein]--UDP-N-acetylglucosamine O-acyltransferase [Deltaproteobacteria bacterium]|nr:MAG: acyl-[acyl-carrier-protein]--UDP-N-acetylglucosamine O-acyltransferase [Deltaproteobacteria bacterium]